MKKKSLLISVILTLTLSSSIVVKAMPKEDKVFFVFPENTTQEVVDKTLIAEELVGEAQKEKTFYKYNVAYAATMEIPNQELQDYLLRGLANVVNDVWNEDIKAINKTISELAINGNGRTYDEVQVQIDAANIADIDKQYLLGEVTSWGKNLVFTPDYSAAVEKVVRSWGALSSKDVNIQMIISEADMAISNVNNSYSKTYLQEQLQQIKDKHSQLPVLKPLVFNKELTEKLSKPFVDIYENGIANTNIEGLIRSAVNISEGKEVDPIIKMQWNPGDTLRPYAKASYVEHKEVVANMKNPIKEYLATKYQPQIPERNCLIFNYTVVYWNPNIDMYEVHNIAIGI